MKTKGLTLIFIILFITGYSLAQDNKNGLTGIRLSYDVSSISDVGNHFKSNETLIPYGIGLECIYSFSKRLKLDLGMIFKTSGKQTEDGYIISEFGGYSGPTHREYRNNYYDISLRLNYSIIHRKSFEIILASGFRGTVFSNKSDNNPDFAGEVGKYQRSSFSTGMDFGLMESLRITNKTGIFSSQYYGYYFLGDIKEVVAIDLSIGLTYNLK